MRRPMALAAVLAAALTLLACAPQLQPPGSGQGEPRLVVHPSGRGALVTRDGLELPLRTWAPDGRPGAVLLALHGFNDYSRGFALPAPELARLGLQTYAYDQRGFGLAPWPGRWAGIGRLALDARDAVRLVAARHPGTPLYLLGESMGGAVAAVALAGDRRPAAERQEDRLGPPAAPLPLDGLILVAPAVWSRGAMPPLYRNLLHAAAHTVPWYPTTGEGLRIQASDNIEALRTLGNDPFVIKRTRIDAIWGLVNLMDAAVAALPAVEVPALLLYGLEDQVVPKAAVLAAADTLSLAPAGPWRVAIYDEGYHLLLRDLGRARVLADIAAWTASQDAPLPSGAGHAALPRLRGQVEGDTTEEAAAGDLKEFAPE